MSSSQVFQNSGVMDLVQSVKGMNQAFTSFSKMETADRVKAVAGTLSDFKVRLEKNAEAIARNLEQAIGVPRVRVTGEMIPTAISLLGQLEEKFKNEVDLDEWFFPSAGHCAVFLGWTDPLVSFVRRIPVLFAAGNAVCLKPSRVSASAYALLGEFWQQSLEAGGLDKGLFQILHGQGEGEDQIGELILRHPALKSIYWIGRTESALKARRIALEGEKRFFYSGSGRNPALIFPHPDEVVFETLLRKMAQTVMDPHGHGPYRPSRFFIQESVYKQSLEILVDELSKTERAGGCGQLPESECVRFDQQTKLALSETGKLATGGQRDGRLISPTLIRDLTNCSTLQGEELAGPAMTAASFKYLHEAVKYANISPLGLSAYVLHPEREKRPSIARKLEVTRVLTAPDVPRATYLFLPASAVKLSQSGEDGLDPILSSSQWRSRLIGPL